MSTCFLSPCPNSLQFLPWLLSNNFANDLSISTSMSSTCFNIQEFRSQLARRYCKYVQLNAIIFICNLTLTWKLLWKESHYCHLVRSFASATVNIPPSSNLCLQIASSNGLCTSTLYPVCSLTEHKQPFHLPLLTPWNQIPCYIQHFPEYFREFTA